MPRVMAVKTPVGRMSWIRKARSNVSQVCLRLVTNSVLRPPVPLPRGHCLFCCSGSSNLLGESLTLATSRRDPASLSAAMAVNPSSIFAPGALPLPPDFRVEAGYEDNAGEYEPHGADAAASSGLEGATFVSPPETRVVPAAAGAQQPFALGSSVGVALAAYGFSAPLRFALLRAFECGEEDSADALGETPEAEVEEVLNEMDARRRSPTTDKDREGLRSELLPEAQIQHHSSTGPNTADRPDDRSDRSDDA